MQQIRTARSTAARVLSLAAVSAVAVTAFAAAPARAAAPAAAPARSTAVPAAPAVAAADPAGPLPATNPGCTGSGTVTCDLYAEAGYTNVVGSSQMLTWRFSPVHLPAATAPTKVTPITPGAPDFGTTGNPTIVVNQGDTLNLVLHNELTDPATSALLPGGSAGAALSLAVPGLRGKDDVTGLDPSTTDTKTYTFTASKAGTFLYEAGHTTVGPRAVAMGLVGAIVVRPTGFGAGAQTDLGSAASAFDDEAVMVLTDVDPKLSADPLGFDLRDFRSTYRMINGASYPKTPDIPTAAGHKVLVRYVNAGVISHAMGPLGLRQNVVAIDAQPSSVGQLVADTIPPGETEDAIIVATEGRTPVYDTAGALDNAGIGLAGDGTTAGLKRVNFGGLIEMLSTTPAVPSADTVGPRTTITAVSGTTLSLTFTDLASPWCATPATCGPSSIAGAEYYADTDPGAGAGTTITAAGGTTVSTTVTVDTSALQNGKHQIYVRAKDSVGNWGAPVSVLLTVLKNGPASTSLSVTPKAVTTASGAASLTLGATGDGTTNGGGVAAMEYFLVAPGGAAPTPGAGTPFTITPGTTVAASATGSVGPNATQGTWTYSVDAQGANGVWGPLASTTFVVDNTGPSAGSVTAKAVTPSPTDGVTGDPVDPTALKVQATFADDGGSPTTGIVAAEGFLGGASAGTPPAATNGKGFVFVANDGVFDGTSATEAAYGLIPLSQLTQFATDGTYYVWVHGKDGAGNWGPLVSVPFVLNRAPVISNLTLTQNTLTSYTLTITGTSSAALTGATYRVNGGAATNCTSGTFGPGAVSLTCPITLAAAPTGDLTVTAQLTSSKGTSAVASTTLANVLPGLAGPVTVGSPAVTQSTTAANPPAVTYFAQFTFAPGTLRTGNNANGYVTIAALRNGAGFGNVVTVQYRRNTTGTTGTLRLQVNGLPSATYNLTGLTSTSSYQLRVRMVAGQAVQLYVGGTLRITGGTVAAGTAVTTAVLGRVGTTGTVTVTGSATVSGYTAKRFGF